MGGKQISKTTTYPQRMEPSRRLVAIETESGGCGLTMGPEEASQEVTLELRFKGKETGRSPLQRKHLVQKDQSLNQHVPQESARLPGGNRDSRHSRPAAAGLLPVWGLLQPQHQELVRNTIRPHPWGGAQQAPY